MEQFTCKKFFKVLNVTGTTGSITEVDSIDLLDTQGNAVQCNYVKVTVALSNGTSNANQHGIYYVRPGGTYADDTVDPTGNTGNPTTDPGAGGAVCGGAVTGDGAEMLVRNDQLFTQIAIGNGLERAEDFVIEYGYKMAYLDWEKTIDIPKGE